MTLFALLLLSVIPHDFYLEDQVTLVELNHFYDEDGWLTTEQLIFYDWSPADNRYQVVDWRHLNRSSYPRRQGDRYQTIWREGDRYRRVTSDCFRETWTQYDPEIAEREYLPKDSRKFLRKPIDKR